MEMKYQGLVTLLRSGITGEPLSLPQDFELEAVEELARKQALISLVFRGAYQCGISKQRPVMQRMHQQYYRIMMNGERQSAAVRKLLRTFEENGIDHMPLKGCNLKGLYPQPELRQMGDADILIREEQYEKIRPIMQSLGYTETKESEYDYCWSSPALYVELHKRLFSSRQGDLIRYYGMGWERAVKGDGFRYDMSPEDEFAYIFCHMMKHFRFCGIGARQIVDLYVFRQAHPQMDENRLQAIMEQLGAADFYGNICRLLRVWFEGDPSDEVTDYMTAFIFSNGSWGSMENKLYAEELLRAQNGVKKARGKSFLRAVFPAMADMQLSYNTLYRHPWLYGVFWVVRIFDILRHRPQNIGKRLTIVRNMSDEKVVAHQNAMARMGLTFDFEEE